MRPELPTGTVTLLFTDIEGSTRLLHTLGPEGYADALAEHRLLLRNAFAAHGGVEVDTQGDAFFVVFPTAPGAVAAAGRDRRHSAPAPSACAWGSTPGRRRWRGWLRRRRRASRRASRRAGDGGQVLLTEATASLLSHDETVTDLGRHRLKDFDGPARRYSSGPTLIPRCERRALGFCRRPRRRFSAARASSTTRCRSSSPRRRRS